MLQKVSRRLSFVKMAGVTFHSAETVEKLLLALSLLTLQPLLDPSPLTLRPLLDPSLLTVRSQLDPSQ